MSASRSTRQSLRIKGAAPAAAKSDALQAARTVARSAAQEVRIIGGQWKRTALPVPVASGLRPTPSRVRETLFNWLGHDLSGWRVLDAFAGSGALGFEAASRGADAVWLIERDPALARSLKRTQARLKALQTQVVQAEALSWMRQSGQRMSPLFDLVLLDPPFEGDLFGEALHAALACVAPGGWIYLEAPKAFGQPPDADRAPDDQAAGPQPCGALARLKLHRHGRAGAVHYHLFQRVEETGAAR